MNKPPFIRLLLVAILSVAMVPAGASGQESRQAEARQAGARQAAEAVARDLFLALKETRWDEATALMHRDVLTSFRERTLRFARVDAEQARSDTVWEPYPNDPDMPEAVAEWFEAKAREAAEQYESHLEQVYEVPSVEALEALSPRDLFARFLAANDPVAIMRLYMSEEDLPRLEDRSVETFLRPSRSPLGSIMEGDSVVYVVYSVRHGPSTHDDRRVAVLPMELTGDGWRARPHLDHSELFSPVPFAAPVSIRALDREEKP